MTQTATTIRASGLSHTYGRQRAVDGVDLTLHKGEILGLLGVNGAGKSTTVRILAGALMADAGRVEICGHDLHERPVQARRHIGYLPERPPLYPELTVNEYLLFCARLHGIPRRRRRDALARVSSECELDAVGRRPLGLLSKGYQQRVGIAQAIIHRPEVIILDEPGSGLDPRQILHMRALIKRLASDHSIIVSSHILPEIRALASRVMLMHQGRVALDAAMADIGRTGSDLWRLGLRRQPAIAELAAIDGVAEVKRLSPHSWRITAQPAVDPAPALARAALDNNWGLLELACEQHTLEEIFIDITTRDEAGTA